MHVRKRRNHDYLVSTSVRYSRLRVHDRQPTHIYKCSRPRPNLPPAGHRRRRCRYADQPRKRWSLTDWPTSCCACFAQEYLAQWRLGAAPTRNGSVVATYLYQASVLLAILSEERTIGHPNNTRHLIEYLYRIQQHFLRRIREPVYAPE